MLRSGCLISLTISKRQFWALFAARNSSRHRQFESALLRQRVRDVEHSLAKYRKCACARTNVGFKRTGECCDALFLPWFQDFSTVAIHAVRFADSRNWVRGPERRVTETLGIL
jgi:hypothetical protein